MLGTAQGVRIGITGLGVHVPEKVMTNDELAELVETSDEWIRERTGIRERRIASQEEALTDIALPAARAALEDAGVEAADIDLLICATVTPDMMFPTSSALLADTLGMPHAAAYDLLAGCTGFVYAIAQAYGMLASGLSRRSLVVGGDVLSKILDWEDRSTLVLFGDGAGAVVMEPVEKGGFIGFELGADGGGGEFLWYPGSGSRHFDDPHSFVKMNGREVFKFATRVMNEHWPEQLQEDVVLSTWSAPNFDLAQDARLEDGGYAHVEDIGDGRAWVSSCPCRSDFAFSPPSTGLSPVQKARLAGKKSGVQRVGKEHVAYRATIHT